MMFRILYILLLAVPFCAWSQSDTLDQTDVNGLKQGYWIIYGRDKPDKGYPAGQRIEEGVYKDNRKHGIWIKYHKDGMTPRLKGTYVKGRPNGEYWKYYPEGMLMEHGFYTHRDKMMNHTRYFKSGCVEKIITDSTRFYYLDDCKLDESEIGSVDTIQLGPVERKGWSHYKYEISEVKYGKGSIIDTVTYNQDQDQVRSPVAPTGEGGHRKDGKPFDPNGYNKLYNKNDEFYLEGEFKNGKLWAGKYYKYSEVGILLKIEIWKNGKYHCDGQL